MASLADLFVRIRGDTTDVNRKIKGTQDSLDSFGRTASRVLGTLGVGLSFREFIQNSVEAQNALAQLNAVVKSTGAAAGFTTPQLADVAGQLQKVSTFSDEAIMGAQGLLLTFTKIRGETLTQATKAVVDLATAMGGDLKGAAIQVGKALQDPTLGLTALRRVGVSFSASQQEVIKNLYATGKVAEAQALILKELQTEFGGSALAARNTLGGALTALKNAFGDALEVSSDASTGIVGAINTIANAMPGARKAAESYFKYLDLGFGLIAIAAMNANIHMARFQKTIGDFLQKVPATAPLADLVRGFGKSQSGAASAILGSDNGQGALIALEKLRAEWINQATALGTVTTSAHNVKTSLDDNTPSAEAAAKAFKKFTDDAHAALQIFNSLTDHGESSKAVNEALANAYDRVQKKLSEIGDRASSARAELLALADALRENLAVAQHIAALNSTGSVGPLVGKTLPGATLAGNNAFQDVVAGFRGHMANVDNPDAQKFMKGLIDAANNDPVIAAEKKNTEALQSMIANTAAQTASIIGNALVSFGSGRGNQIGGALGGSIGGGIGAYIGHQLTTEGGKFIGGALGSAVGSVIPVVGTLVGGFLGSAIGGLFGHHKKAVDANTQALNANTKVMSQLLNEPSGFKVGRARFDATSVMHAITRAALDHRSRGGAMPWAVAP